MDTTNVSKFEKSIITIKAFNEIRNNGKFCLPVYQRGIVSAWEKPAKRDLLIDSILSGYSINTMHVHLVQDNGNLVRWDQVDGQQRARVIASVLSKANPYTPTLLDGDYAILNGKIFDSWPDDLQAKFLTYPLDITNHLMDDDEELSEIFTRLNRPAALTTAQARRGQIVDKLIAIKDLIAHPVWDKAKIKKEIIEVSLMQVLNGILGDSNFSSDHLVDWFRDWQAEKSDLNLVKKSLDQMDFILSQDFDDSSDKLAQKRFAKKIHLVNFLIASNGLNVDNDMICNRVIRFFAQNKKDDTARADYLTACASDTSGTKSIDSRIKILGKVLISQPAPKIEPKKSESKNPEPEPAKQPESAPIDAAAALETAAEKDKADQAAIAAAAQTAGITPAKPRKGINGKPVNPFVQAHAVN